MANEVELFRVLADEARLRILRLLLEERDGACVCELVDALRLPQYEASRQLRILRSAGIVEGVRQGTWVYYRVASDPPQLTRNVLEALRQSLNEQSFIEDQERFRVRLTWRAAGLCVIGYDRQAPFRDSIPLLEIDHDRKRGNST